MSKFFAKSLTVQGAFVLFFSWLIAQFGVEASETEITKVVDSLIALAGFGMVLYGRFKATDKLHIKK